jgi:hypothetical protein
LINASFHTQTTLSTRHLRVNSLSRILSRVLNMALLHCADEEVSPLLTTEYSRT